MTELFQIKAEGLLQQAGLISYVHENLIKSKGEAFNIFSILGMERLEVQTHSAFIYELIQPKGRHGQKHEYLKRFLEQALSQKDFDLTNIRVDRERMCGEHGRIDLVIENDTHIIAIEMKIDAGDQDQQLVRYESYCKASKKKYKLYYLTLFGDDANVASSKKHGEEIPYERISFKFEIHRWLKKCLSTGNTPLLPIIRESIYQYVLLLEKITGQLSGGKIMDLKELLLKDKNILIYQELQKAVPYAKAEIEYKFWEKIFDLNRERFAKLGIEEGSEYYCVDRESEIEKIVAIRSKKKNGYGLSYDIYSREDETTRVFLQQSENEGMWISMRRVICGEAISVDKWDKESQDLSEKIGLNKIGDYSKYRYIKTNISVADENIAELQDDIFFNYATKKLSDELYEVINSALMHIKAQNDMEEHLA